MKCDECNYYWIADGERYPRCHCEETAFAPCEDDEESEENEEEESE